MLEPTDIGTYAVGGAGALTLIAWMIRKAWSSIASTGSDNSKIAGEKTIYDNLREEVARLSTEMKDLRAEHKKEKQELEQRIDDLDTKVDRLTTRLGTVRRRATDAYTKLLGHNCQDCEHINEALAHIEAIIKEE